jgi:RHS repeat-associated protein
MGLNSATDGSNSARFEYGPFGEPIRASGPRAADGRIRFSSKYTDQESGLVYYGYRFYNAVTGRWINRDPIGEVESRNLYGACNNEMMNRIDSDGRQIFPGAYLPPNPQYPVVPTIGGPIDALSYYLLGPSGSTVQLTDSALNQLIASQKPFIKNELAKWISGFASCCANGSIVAGPLALDGGISRKKTWLPTDLSNLGSFQLSFTGVCDWNCPKKCPCECTANCLINLRISKNYTFNLNYNPKNAEWQWLNDLATVARFRKPDGYNGPIYYFSQSVSYNDSISFKKKCE